MGELLSNFGKQGVVLNLSSIKVDIEDTDHLSKYFVLAEYSPVLTAGRNPIAFNGSTLLKPGSEVKVECIDSNGNSLYIEQAKSANAQFSDVANFILSVHVYNETYNGPGKLVFVGTTQKDEIVRWVGNITIDKTLPNSSKVRFYNTPSLNVRPLLYPVIANDPGSKLSRTVEIDFPCHTYAVTPPRDTYRKSVNSKRTNIDYRLVSNGDPVHYGPTAFPSMSFNTQMEGVDVTLNVNKIQRPFSYNELRPDITQSFKIKKVIDSRTVILSDAFYFKEGKDQVLTHVTDGYFSASYKYIEYNTGSDAYLQFLPVGADSAIQIKQSYAEIVYRNLRTYSGFIARHKLYRKSLIYPGDFVLIADEPLNATEILRDPVTLNKTYSEMGIFYNKVHIDKYWNTSSADIYTTHQVSPFINSMKIEANNGDLSIFDGDKYIIVKSDASGSVKSHEYIPYEERQFNNLSGSAYNSNFISLKAGALYVLSSNVIINKDKFTDANLSFYFTSSHQDISKETKFNNKFGWKLGEINVFESVTTKNFADKQMFFFTPNHDYFGTVVIVPKNCSPTLSEFSLKVYGDYGYSPDILFTNIPFKVNIANETFDLRAELFDINSNLVFSNLSTKVTFDPDGESLYNIIPGYSNTDPTKVTEISGSLSISQSLFLPNMESCPQEGVRLVAWHYPINFPPENSVDGRLCYTNISKLIIEEGDYISLTTTDGITDTTAKSLAIKYDGSNNLGRRIFVDENGIKYNYP